VCAFCQLGRTTVGQLATKIPGSYLVCDANSLRSLVLFTSKAQGNDAKEHGLAIASRACRRMAVVDSRYLAPGPHSANSTHRVGVAFDEDWPVELLNELCGFIAQRLRAPVGLLPRLNR
jgi:hypothetical protein